MNPDANGAAIRWHGYIARFGFGTTRIRYHSNAMNPRTGNNRCNTGDFDLNPTILPVLGQTRNVLLTFGGVTVKLRTVTSVVGWVRCMATTGLFLPIRKNDSRFDFMLLPLRQTRNNRRRSCIGCDSNGR